MLRDEILEYPYTGTIMRVVEGRRGKPDTEYVLYSGVMDEHMLQPEEGRTMHTSSYIISIPLTMSVEQFVGGAFDASFSNDFDASIMQKPSWIVPKKGDRIILTRYGETFELTVDNAEPSQLGGVSIYAARSSW